MLFSKPRPHQFRTVKQKKPKFLELNYSTFCHFLFRTEDLPFYKDIDSRPDFIPKPRKTSTPLVSEVVSFQNIYKKISWLKSRVICLYLMK